MQPVRLQDPVVQETGDRPQELRDRGEEVCGEEGGEVVVRHLPYQRYHQAEVATLQQ